MGFDHSANIRINLTIAEPGYFKEAFILKDYL